jgi:hypothetical protein
MAAGGTMKEEQMTVAFALGGLAGNNAHGAGFLKAAIDWEIEPIMISCTSGQILWVSRYLHALENPKDSNLKEKFEEDLRQVNPTCNVNAALAGLALFGKPGVFVPAYVEYLQDMSKNSRRVWRHICTRPHEVLLAQEWLELFPCRFLVPDFPAVLFEKIADVLLNASVGVAFNSYNPRSGEEHVYLNNRARDLLHEKSRSKKCKYDPGKPSDYRRRTIYQNIDAKAVRNGLWLYEYGFDKKESGFVDGAYFRGMILSELAVAQRIFCVRPINRRWQGDMPRNYPELEDLKTEIGFNGSYCGERYQIDLVNKFLDALNANGKGKYHQIDLQEIEIRQPRGYFDYIFESEQVFSDAYKDAIQRFEALGYPERRMDKTDHALYGDIFTRN